MRDDPASVQCSESRRGPVGGVTRPGPWGFASLTPTLRVG